MAPVSPAISYARTHHLGAKEVFMDGVEAFAASTVTKARGLPFCSLTTVPKTVASFCDTHSEDRESGSRMGKSCRVFYSENSNFDRRAVSAAGISPNTRSR